MRFCVRNMHISPGRMHPFTDWEEGIECGRNGCICSPVILVLRLDTIVTFGDMRHEHPGA